MSEERRAKQVIVVRKDLVMSPEKMAAQVAHASLAVVLGWCGKDKRENYTAWGFHVEYDSAEEAWIDHKFTKIVVYASKDELMEAYVQAKEMNIPCSIIVDAGDSEFKGEKTLTCCAIGPAWSDEIDPITGKFPTRKK